MATTVTIRLNATDANVTLGVLSRALPATRQYAGCRYVTTYTNADAPDEIILIQGWDSRTDQERYIAWRQETGDLQQLVATLREPPVVTFWEHNDA